MLHPRSGHSLGRPLGLVAVTIALVGFVNPAAGVDGSPGPAGPARGAHDTGQPVGSIVRVSHDFSVRPHSLSTNELVRCPDGTRLTGGGTSLIGEPTMPWRAPLMYTNGPVGNILPGEGQTWGSEVANRSSATYHYRQFALCVVVK